MKHSQNIVKLFIAALLLTTILTGQANAAGWWNINWPYRVKVKLNPEDISRLKKHELPGNDIAVVQFLTAGLTKKNGEDIRVVTTSGTELASRILHVGPGDLLSLAFAIRPGVDRYHIYFGNQTADRPAKTLEIQRGVLQEVWPYDGGPANNISQAKQALARAKKKPIIGRGFRDRIFAGYDPFSPQNKIVTEYTAYFLAEKSGEYLFVTSSNNASFLFINDRLVVDNGGWHSPQRDTRKNGKISLKKGLNKLTLLQINPWGWPIAVVAYREPGNTKTSIMPPGVFTEILTGQADPIEHYGQAVNIDFSVSQSGEVFMENRYYQRRVFIAQKSGSFLDKNGWLWDFGDGLAVAGPGETPHVYLTPGTYKITLQHKTNPALKRTHSVHIDRDWDKVTQNNLDSLKDYAKIVASYDFRALTPKANMEAVLLFKRAGAFESLHKACEAFLERDKAGNAEIRTILPIYIEALLPIGQAGLGVKTLKHAATMTRNPTVQAEVLVQAGQLQLDPLKQPDEAMKTFEDILTRLAKDASAEIIRDAQIGLGDARLARGNLDQARAAYIQAGIMDDNAKSRQAIVKGDFARQAEDYIRRKDYTAAREILDKWENTLPGDKAEGFSTLLRCKMLLARKKYDAAASTAETLVNANPGSNYAPELLMQAAEAYGELKETNKANLCFEKIIENYRESPLFNTAAEKLKANKASE